MQTYNSLVDCFADWLDNNEYTICENGDIKKEGMYLDTDELFKEFLTELDEINENESILNMYRGGPDA